MFAIQLCKLSKNDLILDPYAGSGTTLLAAKKLGIHFLGIEIEKTYYETAVKRLKKMGELLFTL